jgi:hypothetical protein
LEFDEFTLSLRRKDMDFARLVTNVLSRGWKVRRYMPGKSVTMDVEALGMHSRPSVVTIVSRDESGGFDVIFNLSSVSTDHSIDALVCAANGILEL